MKLRISILMLVFSLIALSLPAFAAGPKTALLRKASKTEASVAPVPPPYAPQVVARVTLKGRNGTIPNTTIFTVGSDGLFRISSYLVATTASPGDQINLGINYTDDVGPTSRVFGEGLQGPGCGSAVCSWVTTFRAVAGSTISYNAEECGACQDTYNLYFTLER